MFPIRECKIIIIYAKISITIWKPKSGLGFVVSMTGNPHESLSFSLSLSIYIYLSLYIYNRYIYRSIFSSHFTIFMGPHFKSEVAPCTHLWAKTSPPRTPPPLAMKVMLSAYLAQDITGLILMNNNLSWCVIRGSFIATKAS